MQKNYTFLIQNQLATAIYKKYIKTNGQHISLSKPRALKLATDVQNTVSLNVINMSCSKTVMLDTMIICWATQCYQ